MPNRFRETSDTINWRTPGTIEVSCQLPSWTKSRGTLWNNEALPGSWRRQWKGYSFPPGSYVEMIISSHLFYHVHFEHFEPPNASIDPFFEFFLSRLLTLCWQYSFSQTWLAIWIYYWQAWFSVVASSVNVWKYSETPIVVSNLTCKWYCSQIFISLCNRNERSRWSHKVMRSSTGL